MRRSSGDSLPTLALPSLAGSAGEAVDSSALRFLTAQALEAKRKEEEQEKVMEELDVLCHIPVAQLTSIQRQRMAEHRRSGALEAWLASVREKKKKRRKKVPKNFFLSRSSHSKIWTLFHELFRSRRLERLLWRCHEFGGEWVFDSSWYSLASTAQRQFRIGLCLQLVLCG